MIDVFLRWYPTNRLREHIARTVLARLEMIRGIRIDVVTLGNCGEPYHINSKKYAEERAKSAIYCVMDDDQLPLRDDFFALGAAALELYDDFGMLSGFPLEYGLQGQPFAGITNQEVIDAHSIGCPYFVRKGTLKHFPDSPIHMYDGDLSKVVTDQGLRTGFARQAIYNHLGYGFSQVGTLQNNA